MNIELYHAPVRPVSLNFMPPPITYERIKGFYLPLNFVKNEKMVTATVTFLTFYTTSCGYTYKCFRGISDLPPD